MSEAPKPEAPRKPEITDAEFEEVKPGLRDAIAKARAGATGAWKKTLGWFDEKERAHTVRRESKKKEHEDARKAEKQKAVDRGKTLFTVEQLKALEDAADSGSAGFTRDDLHTILARASATPDGPKVLQGTREESIVIHHMNKVLEEGRRPEAEREAEQQKIDAKKSVTLPKIREALRDVRPIVERGRASLSSEEQDIIAQARVRSGASGITRREQYLHEYARGKQMPAFGETRRAYNKVEGVLKNKKREYEEMIPEAIRALDETLNKQGAEKLKNGGMLNNLDALVGAGTVSIKDADIFLVLYALSPEERLKRTRKEQKTYDRVLKEVQDDQAGFEKALDKLAKKKGYTAEERERLFRIIENKEEGLNETIVRELVRQGYSKKVVVGDVPAIDIIDNIVASRQVQERRGAEQAQEHERELDARRNVYIERGSRTISSRDVWNTLGTSIQTGAITTRDMQTFLALRGEFGESGPPNDHYQKSVFDKVTAVL